MLQRHSTVSHIRKISSSKIYFLFISKSLQIMSTYLVIMLFCEEKKTVDLTNKFAKMIEWQEMNSKDDVNKCNNQSELTKRIHFCKQKEYTTCKDNLVAHVLRSIVHKGWVSQFDKLLDVYSLTHSFPVGP